MNVKQLMQLTGMSRSAAYKHFAGLSGQELVIRLHEHSEILCKQAFHMLTVSEKCANLADTLRDLSKDKS
jgi:hypothetical protein